MVKAKNDNSEMFYFPHNCNTQGKKNIKKLIRDMGYEGYGLYWSVLEFMYTNELEVGEEDLILGEEYTDKIIRILNDYELFYVQDGRYISDRILANIERAESKKQTAKNNANARWLLSTFKKSYEDVFGKSPILDGKEIETLKRYDNNIPDFRKILPDIVYTLSFIKFDENIKRKPLCDWLLEGNNLGKIYNGEYGTLKHKPTASELKAKEREIEAKKAEEENAEKELKEQLDSIENKQTAIEYVLEHSSSLTFISPPLKALMKRFDITTNDLTAQYEEQRINK